jgi:hypothetical protein
MKKIKIFLLIITAIYFSAANFGCTGALDAITNLKRLQFKLGSINAFTLANVRLDNKRTINDISILDAANLLAAFTRGELPASFTLNVLAKNPNDGTGGTRNTTAILKSLAWRLFIDNKETINGNIGSNIEIPGVGQTTTIPIVMALDLVKFFKDNGYENILNLALALGGVSGSAARVTLKATPTIDTFLGPITYPGEISIIDREFRSQ